MLTDLGHYTVMTNTVHLLLPIDGDELTTQRMVRIANNKLFTLMMGSMLALRSADRNTFSTIWPATRIGWQSPTTGWSTSSTAM